MTNKITSCLLPTALLDSSATPRPANECKNGKKCPKMKYQRYNSEVLGIAVSGCLYAHHDSQHPGYPKETARVWAAAKMIETPTVCRVADCDDPGCFSVHRCYHGGCDSCKSNAGFHGPVLQAKRHDKNFMEALHNL